MKNYQVLKEQATLIDKELINLTNSTNSFFETTTKTPITELENYLTNLKKFGNDVQVELDLQRKNLHRSKKQIKDVKETLNKLDDLIASYNTNDSSISNLSEQFNSSARLEILEKESDDSYFEDNSNEQPNGCEAVNIDDLLNKALPQL